MALDLAQHEAEIKEYKLQVGADRMMQRFANTVP